MIQLFKCKKWVLYSDKKKREKSLYKPMCDVEGGGTGGRSSADGGRGGGSELTFQKLNKSHSNR